MREFEWDDKKATANELRHRVSFEEAETVFGDTLGLTVFDPARSDREIRYVTIGMSELGRILVVAHTDRGQKTRIISARKATKRERRNYENVRFP